jgi:signal transduction histidine kinase
METSSADERLLAEAAALSSSLDTQATLDRAVELLTGGFADCCLIEIVDGDERRRRAACRDPALGPLCAQFEEDDEPLIETHEPLLLAAAAEHVASLGRLRPCALMALPLVASGRHLGMLTLVSLSRRYHGGDLDTAEELAARVAAAVDNARRYAAALAAIRLRDELLAAVAHDLKNPLIAIRMMTNLLDGDGGLPLPKAVAAIQRSTAQMSDLIQDLLTVSRLETDPERKRLAPVEIAAAAVQASRPSAAAAEIDLRLETPALLPAVWADRDQLLGVFAHLIGNAVRRTPAGGVIDVGAALDGGEVRFHVGDNGRAISSGIAVARSLVEACGGRLRAERDGDGNHFYFAVPAVADLSYTRSRASAR